MGKYDNQHHTEDGIPLLQDLVRDAVDDDSPLFLSKDQRLDFIENLARELHDTFSHHTHQVMHGMLDGSPEQLDQQLYLRIRELLKTMLPDTLPAENEELKQDESDY